MFPKAPAVSLNQHTITKTVGNFLFKSGIGIKVNDAEASEPGVGKNRFSAELENMSAYDAPVNFVAATYKNIGGYKALAGSRVVTKMISAGASESFAIDITAADTDSEIRIYAFSEFAEPIVLPLGNIDYIGSDSEGGILMAIYKINSFK